MSEMVFFMMANTTNVGVVGIHSDDLIDCSGSCLKKLAGIYGGLSHDIRARTEESARMAFSNFWYALIKNETLISRLLF